MLAIDTNLIVRYLVGDDPKQAAAARRSIDRNNVFVSSTVLLETEWVLRSLYNFSRNDCADSIAKFAGLPNVTIDDVTSVADAINLTRQGLDFADALHIAKSRDCDVFITFDQDLVKSANRAGVKARIPS